MNPFLFKNRSYGWWTIILGSAFIIGLVFSFFLFDIILSRGIADIMNLRIGCKERRYYQTMPFPLTVKVYIFHVLNTEDVQNGAKPHFKEIGPFAFDEHNIKNNVVDDLEADTMDFDLEYRYVFRPDLSEGLTGDEVITTLHPVLVGIGMTVHFEFRQFMHVAIEAIKEIFNEPKDMFWTGRAMDFIFDGILIDCNVTNPLSKIACKELKKRKDPNFKHLEDNKLLFSFFGGHNHSLESHWKIYRGVKDIYQAGQIVELDGQSELTVWSGPECNRIDGTDGILFTPFRQKDKPLAFYEKQICASFYLNYKRKSSYRGIDLHSFVEDFSEKNLSCFCRNPEYCPLYGTMDLFPCVKAPITVSLPHFLHADPSLRDNVASGLNPNVKDHEFTMSLELNSAVDMNPQARVQINYEIEPVKEIEIMSNIPKMIFPIFWFEKTANIPDFMTNYLKYTVAIGKTFNSLVIFLTLTFGLFGTLISLTLFLLKRFTDVNIFEEEKTFIQSPNTISKIITEANTNEEKGHKSAPNANAVLLLSDVVNEATKEVNKCKLQKDCD